MKRNHSRAGRRRIRAPRGGRAANILDPYETNKGDLEGDPPEDFEYSEEDDKEDEDE